MIPPHTAHPQGVGSGEWGVVPPFPGEEVGVPPLPGLPRGVGSGEWGVVPPLPREEGGGRRGIRVVRQRHPWPSYHG